ncbi:citrate synthase-like protein [Pelagophyceae sp. CCMP2097]|nr:citrate synthase-like protein [Pelagophyceae sp. CCMP2097]
MAGSSDANPFACVAAGIASLWGPMHGGANEACMAMLRLLTAYITAAVPVEQFVGEPTDARRLFRLAAELEEAALADEYFSSRKLFPNVDFYSGLALTAIGVPEAL